MQRRGEPLEMLQELNTALYQAFDYAPNSTQVDSPIDDALRTRKGVCQDFAHIMIALVRQLRHSLPLRQRLSLSRRQVRRPLTCGRHTCLGGGLSWRGGLGGV